MLAANCFRMAILMSSSLSLTYKQVTVLRAAMGPVCKEF